MTIDELRKIAEAADKCDDCSPQATAFTETFTVPTVLVLLDRLKKAETALNLVSYHACSCTLEDNKCDTCIAEAALTELRKEIE